MTKTVRLLFLTVLNLLESKSRNLIPKKTSFAADKQTLSTIHKSNTIPVSPTKETKTPVTSLSWFQTSP